MAGGPPASQLFLMLHDEILRGHPAGDPLPTYTGALAISFGVSRITSGGTGGPAVRGLHHRRQARIVLLHHD